MQEIHAHIMPRELAKSLGVSVYFSGEPCRKGHSCPRFSNEGKCVFCCRDASAARNLLKSEARNKAESIALADELDRYRKAVEDGDERPIISRKNAEKLGLYKYFTGVPCKRGHVEFRYTNNTTCYGCVTTEEYTAAQSSRAKAKYWEDPASAIAKCIEARKKNPEASAAYAKKWQAANKDKIRAAEAARKARDPEAYLLAYRGHASKRRARKRGGMNVPEFVSWVAAQKKVCYWCSRKCSTDYHVDHYYPLAKGGKHEASNLVIACARCNQTKSAKDPYLFAKSVGRLF
jgi:5-methylcytosine-specific restriction endonuclease McrA